MAEWHALASDTAANNTLTRNDRKEYFDSFAVVESPVRTYAHLDSMSRHFFQRFPLSKRGNSWIQGFFGENVSPGSWAGPLRAERRGSPWNELFTWISHCILYCCPSASYWIGNSALSIFSYPGWCASPYKYQMELWNVAILSYHGGVRMSYMILERGREWMEFKRRYTYSWNP